MSAAAPNSYSITALQIANPEAFRDKVRAKLTERFKNIGNIDGGMTQDAAANAALNLERGIYNYTLRESDTKNIVKNGTTAISCRFMPTACAPCASTWAVVT